MLAVAITFNLTLNNLFDELRQFLLHADSPLLEPFINLNVISLPKQIYSSDLPHCNMLIAFWIRPVTR